MRKIICNSCSFVITEADKNWDVMISNGKCSNCNVYIQPPQPRAPKPGANTSKTNSELDLEKSERSSLLVTATEMPFWSIVKFTLKWALASVPAIYIVVTVFRMASHSFR